jgi:hypothetical protein
MAYILAISLAVKFYNQVSRSLVTGDSSDGETDVKPGFSQNLKKNI